MTGPIMTPREATHSRKATNLWMALSVSYTSGTNEKTAVYTMPDAPPTKCQKIVIFSNFDLP